MFCEYHMSKVQSQLRRARFDFGEYVFFVLSTGTYQTFSQWRAGGRPNPHRREDYRDDMVTRTQIVNLFFKEG